MRTAVLTARRAPILATTLALLAAACSGTASPTPTASAVASASHAPVATSIPATPSTADTPAPSSTPAAAASSSPGACPALPTDLATVRDLAKAKEAVDCFGNQALTFRAYVPTTDGLGGVPASKMTPGWIADPFTGAILQPGPLAQQDQNAWLVVRVAPALGKCRVTDVQGANCPFGAYLNNYVTVTGHFKDTAAPSCQSAALPGSTDAGPSKAKMVARCKREFVVTAITAG